MDTKRIIKYLRQIAANNNRDWFYEHKAEYDACREEFKKGVAAAIARISTFDESIAHLTPKDCIFRFNRDIRFSQDKSPYKTHFGAYISAKGKKSLHAGYYIHIEPGNCLVSAGAYWLPTKILTAMRNDIMGRIDKWRECVENGQFVSYFGYANEGKWTWNGEISEKGFGIEHLKTCPKDFPRDYEHIEYLRMKDYCVWRVVPDDFYAQRNWLDEFEKYCKVAKPMMDFTNEVIDDYE